MTQAKNATSNASTKTAKATKKEAKVETRLIAQAEMKETKADVIFAQSVERIKEKRSTGNATLDELGSKVLYGIHEGKLGFKEVEEDHFVGTLGKASIDVTKIQNGKVNKIILNVAGIEILGEFAARAFKMMHAKTHKTGRRAPKVDAEQVASVLDLLD